MKNLSLLVPYGLVAFLLIPVSLKVRAETVASDAKVRAAAALEQDVKMDPNNPELWLHLGFAHRKDGHIDQAQNAFEKAAQLDPHNSDAFYMLGLIYESKHQNAEAQRAWQSYLGTETDGTKRALAQKHIHRLTE